jgi:hypothetical protein
VKWSEPAASPTLSVMIQRPVNTFFCDCSAESPQGRRSLCYDRQALQSRKENKPQNNAMDVVAAMGVELLIEDKRGHRRVF